MAFHKLRIGICGSGNVAYHLVDIFALKGHSVDQIFSRNKKTAQELCDIVNAENIESPSKFTKELDMVILAVKDDSIQKISSEIDNNILCVHTSGSTELNRLSSKKKGVFYPLQTFSRSKKIDWKNVPICIEASNDSSYKTLEELAIQISSRVEKIDSKQRKSIHVAAVFACNFTNHMLALAEKISKDQGIDYTILQPLIKETFEKSIELTPTKAQTGPASRNDHKLLEDHINALEGNPEIQNLYRLISKSISNLKNNEKL